MSSESEDVPHHFNLQFQHWSRYRDKNLGEGQAGTDDEDEYSQNEDGSERFIRQTIYNLVVRMMHFYDFISEKSHDDSVLNNFRSVLRFTGWNESEFDEIVNDFWRRNLGLNTYDTNLTRSEIRCAFKAWIELVSSEPCLLFYCFKFFDVDLDGSMSKDEIVKIFYRTTDETRIKLNSSVITKLDPVVDYAASLGIDIEEHRKKNLKTKSSEQTEGGFRKGEESRRHHIERNFKIIAQSFQYTLLATFCFTCVVPLFRDMYTPEEILTYKSLAKFVQFVTPYLDFLGFKYDY